MADVSKQKPRMFRHSRRRDLFNGWRDVALRYFWFIVPTGALRLVPGSSRKFGPPRRRATRTSYRHNNLAWRSVFPARKERLALPYFCNDPKVRFNQYEFIDWPEFGVAEIQQGRLLDEHAWVVGANDTFLGDFCHSGNEWYCPVNRIIKLHPVTKLSGRVLNLCTAYAVHNYYHYVLDGLGRWELARRAGYRWDDFSHVILPRFNTAATDEIRKAIGIPADKVVQMGRRQHLECEILVQPSFPGLSACAAGWVFDLFRNHFPPPERSVRCQVYLPRRGPRVPINNDAIEARMRELGFEFLDPLSTPNFRQRLAEATHVVAIHGAALANLVFCRPGTRVLEMMPTDLAHFRNFSYFSTLCAGGGMPYGAVIGKSLKERLASFAVQTDAAFEVNLNDLNAGLASLLEDKEPDPVNMIEIPSNQSETF